MAKALPLIAVLPEGALSQNAPLMLHTRLEEMLRFADVVADPSNVDELHAMRIAAKRLRYTMEIFAPVYRADPEWPKLYALVKSVQEQIGDIHDADVRIPALSAFLSAHAPARPEIRAGLHTLILAQQRERDKKFRTFQRFWQRPANADLRGRFLRLLSRPAAPQESSPHE